MMYDIAIIGRGPAGVSAAINSAVRNKNIILFGQISKKVSSAPSIPNYLGLKMISGEELVKRFEEHLKEFNIAIDDRKVLTVYAMGDYFSLQVENDMVEAKTVILASGVDFKKSIENEDIYLGSGVSYCATCDAPLYKGKDVAVVGYNEESYEEAKFLSEVCKRVIFVPIYKKEFSFPQNVEIVDDSPVRFENKEGLKLILKNQEIKADGYFILKDSLPLSSMVPGIEADGPHVIVNKKMETNIKGLYAAGDITGKPYQIAKAVGEGQVAALNAVDFISNIK